MRNVFVSKPSSVNPAQARFWNGLSRRLADRGLKPRTVGGTDFLNCAPSLTAIRKVVSECDGMIVLGFRTAELRTLAAGGMSAGYSSTPWNQIEATFGFESKMPLMVLKEGGVTGGIFDVGSSASFVHEVQLNASWFSSPKFLQPFNAWHEEVLRVDHSLRVGS